MTRYLLTLAVALVSIFAVSVMTASADQDEQGMITSDGPVTLDMFETGIGQNATTMFGEKIECQGTIYTGHQYDVTPHQPIPQGATTITVTPHYNNANCTAFPGPRKATITMNGCDFVFHIGNTVGVDRYALFSDIVCPVGQQIEKHVYFGPADEAMSWCTYTIGPQAGLPGARVITTTNGANDFDIVGTFQNIHVEKHGMCGIGTTNAGQWDVDLTVKGTDLGGLFTPVTVTDLV